MPDAAGPPLVSAIIVVLDGEDFLNEAIDSVIAQTLTDWELIVADDGSTDRTREIGRARAAADPRIRLIAHPDGGNFGIAATRNLALGEACGTYVAFIDADDVWLPDKLAEQVAIMESDPELGLVYGRSLIWHSWNPANHQPDYYYPLGVEADRRHEPPLLLEVLLRNQSQSPTPCNVMIRADLLRRLGGFEPRFRTVFEDYSFYCRALAVTPAHVSDRTWAKYRQHPASCTAVLAASGQDDVLWFDFLRWLEVSMVSMRPSRRIRRAIRRERVRVTVRLARRAAQNLTHRLRNAIRA
jgi:glycosyltransferase involved in cell wall biosynthesis